MKTKDYFTFGAGYCVGAYGRFNYVEVNGEGAAIELREMKKLYKWLGENIKWIEAQKKKRVKK